MQGGVVRHACGLPLLSSEFHTTLSGKVRTFGYSYYYSNVL